MKLAKATKCEVNNCFYNRDRACRTLGIKVGFGSSLDEAREREAFCRSTTDCGNLGRAVGRTHKVKGYAHNARLECKAPGGEVVYRDPTP